MPHKASVAMASWRVGAYKLARKLAANRCSLGCPATLPEGFIARIVHPDSEVRPSSVASSVSSGGVKP